MPEIASIHHIGITVTNIAFDAPDSYVSPTTFTQGRWSPPWRDERPEGNSRAPFGIQSAFHSGVESVAIDARRYGSCSLRFNSGRSFEISTKGRSDDYFGLGAILDHGNDVVCSDDNHGCSHHFDHCGGAKSGISNGKQWRPVV
jgi:hypothetical protein